jgi:hypothetical protein
MLMEMGKSAHSGDVCKRDKIYAKSATVHYQGGV